eukprot:TRINITY_DN6012_c0_g1_i1.p1 TRINITY_DN6012_c0_g1~~TRINITY_DN6012_c0_g1_i1.p1  ORF type:complete len:102 (+),score=32.42 TRINITY_DN6012_c0_g1_i1:134-439(+)
MCIRDSDHLDRCNLNAECQRHIVQCTRDRTAHGMAVEIYEGHHATKHERQMSHGPVKQTGRVAIGPASEELREPLPQCTNCLLYTSPSPRDRTRSRMPSSA